MSAVRKTRVEVDLGAVCENAARIRKLAGPLLAVVKADAYGHGATQVATALARAGDIAGFAVSLVEEAVELRQAGITDPILVMGPALDGGEDEIFARDLTPLISDPGDLLRIAAAARRRETEVSIHVKIDTGMTRLGIADDKATDLLTGALTAGGIRITGIATHLACADTDDPGDPDSMTAAQLARFDSALARLTERDIVSRETAVHTANSAAALRFAAARKTLVRPGLAIYGNGPAAREAGLTQALRLTTEIAQLRTCEPESRLSYGALFTARKRTRIAVLPIGYADGLPRQMTFGGEVLIRGRRCPIAGAVSMDMTLVDVTALGDDVAVGDEVVALGRQNGVIIHTGEAATRSGLIEYEVTCGLSKRVPRTHR